MLIYSYLLFFYWSSSQLDLFMEESEDEIKVTWGVSHLDTVELQVTPTFTQVHFH